MFVSITTNTTSPSKSLRDLGIASDSNSIVSLNEFTYARESEIYGEGEPADYVYQVKTGAVRSYKLLSDGRRQIGAFHLVGDIFGMEIGHLHRFTAEAIVETTVRLVKRRTLEIVAKSDAAVSRDLFSMTISNLMHAENHLLLLGRQTSLEKVAAFLAEMDRRLTADGVIQLPMTRRDIGDYLGLTVETVSRALSELRGAGVLKFLSKSQREIVILDKRQLAMCDVHADRRAAG